MEGLTTRSQQKKSERPVDRHSLLLYQYLLCPSLEGLSGSVFHCYSSRYPSPSSNKRTFFSPTRGGGS